MLAVAVSAAGNTGDPAQVAGGAGLFVSGAVDFVRVAAGGVLIGLGLGWLTAQVKDSRHLLS